MTSSNPEAPGIFVLLINAVADDGNEYAVGSQKHLIVLIRATSREAAFSEALVALSDKKWRNAELLEAEPMSVAPAAIASPVLREAALRAEQGHRSIIVHDRL